MPRNSSGSMAPANGPYISGTTISSVSVNARFADIETETTDGLSRSGKGGMLAVLRGVDGTVANPAVSFTAEPATGFYRAGASDVRLALAGVDAAKWTTTGDQFLVGPGSGFPGPAIVAQNANKSLALQGNRSAADAGTDVILSSTTTRTAGNLALIQNLGTSNGLVVTYQGLLQLASQAGPIQPAALWTAITPNANWTAVNGLAYWKDAGGVVHLKGGATSNGTGGAAAFNLPAGFRPTVGRVFILSDGTGAGIVKTTVSAAGDVGGSVVLANGSTLNVDPVSFLAEQ